MSFLSKLGNMLDDTYSRIETFAKETAKNPKDVSPKQLKDMLSLVTTTNRTLTKAIQAQTFPDFDQSTIKTILSDINKLKKHSPLKNLEGKKGEQKEMLVSALSDLQSNLKDMAKLKKEMPPVKIEAFSGPHEAINKNLVKHLTMADAKLIQLSQYVKSEGKIPSSHVTEVTKILHQASKELGKAQEFGTSVVKQMPDQNQKTIQRILQNIQTLDRNVGVQVMVGTYSVQVGKFKKSLKELEERLRVLNILKKSRGKETSHVEKDSDSK